jgi:hypothetical protein
MGLHHRSFEIEIGPLDTAFGRDRTPESEAIRKRDHVPPAPADLNDDVDLAALGTFGIRRKREQPTAGDDVQARIDAARVAYEANMAALRKADDAGGLFDSAYMDVDHWAGRHAVKREALKAEQAATTVAKTDPGAFDRALSALTADNWVRKRETGALKHERPLFEIDLDRRRREARERCRQRIEKDEAAGVRIR